MTETAGFPDIAGFRVQRVIGRGGFATVYRAEQPRFDRTVALKVLHPAAVADSSVVQRFERECRAVGSLTGHPTVVQVFEAGTTAEGHPFLAMEYLPGGSLQGRLERHGPAPWPAVVSIAAAVADALAAAHEVGIVHRDVKPANVLCDRSGHHSKLGDFGIAGLATATGTTTSTTAATVAYAAPEVLLGERATPRSDLYGLGATLYALLMGAPAFRGATDESIVPMILRVTSQQLPPIPAHVASDDLRSVITQLMAKDPGARSPSARTVAEWFRQMDPRTGVIAPPRAGAATGAGAGAPPGRAAAGPGAVPPGGRWAADPAGRWPLRWWDGTAWTHHVSDGTNRHVDAVQGLRGG